MKESELCWMVNSQSSQVMYLNPFISHRRPQPKREAMHRRQGADLEDLKICLLRPRSDEPGQFSSSSRQAVKMQAS